MPDVAFLVTFRTQFVITALLAFSGILFQHEAFHTTVDGYEGFFFYVMSGNS